MLAIVIPTCIIGGLRANEFQILLAARLDGDKSNERSADAKLLSAEAVKLLTLGMLGSTGLRQL